MRGKNKKGETVQRQFRPESEYHIYITCQVIFTFLFYQAFVGPAFGSGPLPQRAYLLASAVGARYRRFRAAAGISCPLFPSVTVLRGSGFVPPPQGTPQLHRRSLRACPAANACQLSQPCATLQHSRARAKSRAKARPYKGEEGFHCAQNAQWRRDLVALERTESNRGRVPKKTDNFAR